MDTHLPAGRIRSAHLDGNNMPPPQIVLKSPASLFIDGAAGCTVVAKPSPETPIDAYMLAECMEDAGVPAGVFNFVLAGREGGIEGLEPYFEVKTVYFA